MHTHTATEAAGEELRKQIEQKAGPVTDVVNTVGTWNLAKANILSQSLETLTKVIMIISDSLYIPYKHARV